MGESEVNFIQTRYAYVEIVLYTFSIPNNIHLVD